METTNYRLKVTFLTPILGTQPQGDMARFLAERKGIKLPDDEAPETLPDYLDERTTIFARDDHDEPVLLDYQVGGFLKEAAKVLNGKVTGNVKNLRSKVENTVFVSPRKIALHLPPKGEVDVLERPLRADTPYGARVVLARSEMLPAETWFTCGLAVVPGDIKQSVLEDLLDYGFFKGFLQWRNGGWGRFRYELTAEK